MWPEYTDPKNVFKPYKMYTLAHVEAREIVKKYKCTFSTSNNYNPYFIQPSAELINHEYFHFHLNTLKRRPLNSQ